MHRTPSLYPSAQHRRDWAAVGPSYYALARMLGADPATANVAGILDEYYSAFGAAAAQMRAYHSYDHAPNPRHTSTQTHAHRCVSSRSRVIAASTSAPTAPPCCIVSWHRLPCGFILSLVPACRAHCCRSYWQAFAQRTYTSPAVIAQIAAYVHDSTTSQQLDRSGAWHAF